MTTSNHTKQLTLHAAGARELMSPNPVSVPDVATVSEVIALLMDRGFSAAPVINEAGHPVGVVSTRDIIMHDREHSRHLEHVPEFYTRSESKLGTGERLSWDQFQIEAVDRTPVREIMTPAIFSVPLDASAERVVQEMVTHGVHRVFVVDGDGVLVGVISTLDVLRRLKP